MSNKPCQSCPWRRDCDPSLIPGFSIEQAREKLPDTSRSKTDQNDGFRKVMACHHSSEDNNIICRGYAAIEGIYNIAVRIMAATKEIDLKAIQDDCEDLDLHQSFPEMLADLEKKWKKIHQTH